MIFRKLLNVSAVVISAGILSACTIGDLIDDTIGTSLFKRNGSVNAPDVEGFISDLQYLKSAYTKSHRPADYARLEQAIVKIGFYSEFDPEILTKPDLNNLPDAATLIGKDHQRYVGPAFHHLRIAGAGDYPLIRIIEKADEMEEEVFKLIGTGLADELIILRDRKAELVKEAEEIAIERGKPRLHTTRALGFVSAEIARRSDGRSIVTGLVDNFSNDPVSEANLTLRLDSPQEDKTVSTNVRFHVPVPAGKRRNFAFDLPADADISGLQFVSIRESEDTEMMQEVNSRRFSTERLDEVEAQIAAIESQEERIRQAPQLIKAGFRQAFSDIFGVIR